MPAPLLHIDHLSISFKTDAGTLRAVSDLTLTLQAGKITALVGESGCGKSVTAMSILRLLESPPAQITSGRILFEGEDLLTMPEPQLRRIRGNQIAMIFQEPMTSLNPVFTVGEQIAEVFRVHAHLSRSDALAAAAALLQEVGIPDAKNRVHAYPHELSGGMRQRVMIAMAIACKPKLLIADEPTTALDVTVQAQILALLKELQLKTHMGILLITHDLGVVAEVADHVAVMYSGEIVEQAPVRDLFHHPRHPYTQGLMNAVPTFGRHTPLEAIPGRVPRLYSDSAACNFRDRCKYVQDKCHQSHPPLENDGHQVRCYFPLVARFTISPSSTVEPL